MSITLDDDKYDKLIHNQRRSIELLEKVLAIGRTQRTSNMEIDKLVHEAEGELILHRQELLGAQVGPDRNGANDENNKPT